MKKRISKDELKEIVEKHGYWIKQDCDGQKNMRANLIQISVTHIL